MREEMAAEQRLKSLRDGIGICDAGRDGRKATGKDCSNERRKMVAEATG